MGLVIKEIKCEDQEILDEALKLLNNSQGDGLFPNDFLIRKIENRNAIVLIAWLDDVFVSVATAEILSDLHYYKPFDRSIESRCQGKKVGSIYTSSVADRYRGRGIGQAMTRYRLNWLENRGCEIALGISWLSGLEHTSKRVFEKLGFKAVSKVDRFFRDHTNQDPFECPGCEVHPCECSAILYEWQF
ncbi:MAG: GNAT family N-acetyltransferase [Verrucomicrobiota bacterium]